MVLVGVLPTSPILFNRYWHWMGPMLTHFGKASHGMTEQYLENCFATARRWRYIWWIGSAGLWSRHVQYDICPICLTLWCVAVSFPQAVAVVQSSLRGQDPVDYMQELSFGNVILLWEPIDVAQIGIVQIVPMYARQLWLSTISAHLPIWINMVY